MKKLITLLYFVAFALQLFAQDKTASMPFTILDSNGMFLATLKSTDIQVFKNKDFSLEMKTDNPIDAVIMIDTSMSQERVLPLEKQIAEYFVDKVLESGRDRVSIVSFTGKAFVELGLSTDLKTAREKIKLLKIIAPKGYLGGGIVAGTTNNSNQTIQGSTSIWESTKEVVKSLHQLPGNNSKRTVIVISDGVNTYGDTKKSDLIEYAVMTKIPIYAVGVGDDFYQGVDKKNLKKLTDETGGVAIFPKSEKEFATEFSKIAKTLRSGYEVTFKMLSNQESNKLQEAKIEIINPDLRKQKLEIIQPKGFFFQNQK